MQPDPKEPTFPSLLDDSSPLHEVAIQIAGSEVVPLPNATLALLFMRLTAVQGDTTNETLIEEATLLKLDITRRYLPQLKARQGITSQENRRFVIEDLNDFERFLRKRKFPSRSSFTWRPRYHNYAMVLAVDILPPIGEGINADDGHGVTVVWYKTAIPDIYFETKSRISIHPDIGIIPEELAPVYHYMPE